MANASASHDGGFVLLLVLALTAVVAAAAMVLINVNRSASFSLNAAASNAQALASAKAGLARLRKALAEPVDDLRTQLRPDGDPVLWTFDGKTIHLEIVAESGKVDLNRGAPDSVRPFLLRCATD